MDLSIVFPMFWGREKKEIVKDGDYFYDHPTALDDEGTIPPLFESLKILKDREFDVIAIAGANHPSAHHVTNIVVSEEDGEVRVHSKFLAPYTRPSHDPRRWYGGDYHDVVVRTPAGWRFARRACTARWLLTPEVAAGEAIPEHRRTW